MNIFKFILFYIYSGCALIGLCASEGDQLTWSVPDDTPEDIRQKMILARTNKLDSVMNTAIQIGNVFSNAVDMSVIGSVQKNTIDNYEAARAANAAVLTGLPTLNTKGA